MRRSLDTRFGGNAAVVATASGREVLGRHELLPGFQERFGQAVQIEPEQIAPVCIPDSEVKVVAVDVDGDLFGGCNRHRKLNRPGITGDSIPWKRGWRHGQEAPGIEEVPA